MLAVIMAGGKGTRIQSVNKTVPKPMIRVLGKPILEYQIDCIKRNGIETVILIIGYMGEQIQNYFEDGSRFGISIHYIKEDEELGTAGALFFLKDILKEDFLLCNGDLIFDINIKRFFEFHKRKGGIATLFTHPNSHPYDSGIIVKDNEGKVLYWYHKEEQRGDVPNCVNAGLHFFSPDIFKYFADKKKRDMDRDILRPILKKEKIYAYNSPEYVKDMGTPDRLLQVEEDIINGIVSKKNLQNRQKAIFLDRDGTLNVYKGFLRNVTEMELEKGVTEAIRLINRSEYLAIVVTNQPVIARGECTIEKLYDIHNRMEGLLGKQGAYLDGIFFCPHHPKRGFAGERVEYKIECDCRKPRTGLLVRAAEQYNIDLSQSYMIGDTFRDVETGINANCKGSFLIEKPEKNLLFWIRYILDRAKLLT